MSDIRIGFEHLKLEPAYRDRTYLLRDVVGELTIRVDDRVLFSDPEFPILELATALARWLGTSAVAGEPFRFDSMEAEESPLIEFRSGRDGWTLRSARQPVDQKRPFILAGLLASAEAFVVGTRVALLAELGLDVSDGLERAGRSSDASDDWWRSLGQ